MHQALYRKWRPQSFSDVVGQDHITSVLRYEVKNNLVSHAYLFCGSRGTGKTTCAKILAKAVNCLSPVDGNPCGVCNSCKEIEAGRATDILEMDAASNTGVDYIRDIREEVVFSPSLLKNRVYIIDEVHMLSDGAFNALLKTLEEPPQNVIFILATTEVQKIPQTILSRCQRFDFRRIETSVIANRIIKIANSENIDITNEAAHLIAKLSQGGMRDAISLLELCSADGKRVDKATVERISGSVGRENIERTINAIAEKDIGELFTIVAEVYNSAKDISVFWQEIIAYYRDMLVIKAVKKLPKEELISTVLDVTEDEFTQVCKLADRFNFETLLHHSKLLEAAYMTISRGNDNKRLCAEMTLAELTMPEVDTSNAALLTRIAELEERVARAELGLSDMTTASAANRLENTGLQNKQTSAKKESLQTAPKVKAQSTLLETEKQTQPKEKANRVVGAELSEVNFWPEVVKKYEKFDKLTTPFIANAKVYKTEDNALLVRLSDRFAINLLEKCNADKAILDILRMMGHNFNRVVIEYISNKIEDDNLDEI